MDVSLKEQLGMNVVVVDEKHQRTRAEEIAELARIGLEFDGHFREILKTPEQQRREHEYMFGPSMHVVPNKAKSAKTIKSRKANKVASKQRKKRK